MHDAPAPQAVPAVPCVQALAPLQVPVLPQGGLAVHWPAGAAVPAASGVQVPGDVPLQVWHVPQLGLPQQTLFTQLPLMHWFPAVQTRPFALSAQFRLGAVPWQVNGDKQWESIAQVLRQVSPPHMYGEQFCALGARQLPVPLQCETGVKVEPEHDCAPHDTVVAASWQAPAPLHAPVFPQGGLAVHRLSALPSGVNAQLPALVPTLHDWQSEQELVLQQTPSTQ